MWLFLFGDGGCDGRGCSGRRGGSGGLAAMVVAGSLLLGAVASRSLGMAVCDGMARSTSNAAAIAIIYATTG